MSLTLLSHWPLADRLSVRLRRRRHLALIEVSGLFDAIWYLSQHRDVAHSGDSPILHYLRFGAAEGRCPNPLFDSAWYLAQNPDVAKAGLNPLVHYLLSGAAEGRDPHPQFDTSAYLARHPDVAETGINPLAHFIRREAAESREPAYLSRIAELTSATRTFPCNTASIRHRTAEAQLAPDPNSQASTNASIRVIGAGSPNNTAVRSENQLISQLEEPAGRRFPGWCPICADNIVFHQPGNWLRDQLLCGRCGSIPRWRAVIHVLELYFPDWRQLRIHESSPGGAASDKLQRECSEYCATHFFPGVPVGDSSRGIRCENLEDQTFPNNRFDLVITQDVFEHVLDPARGFKEVARTLRPGGAHVFTVPWYYWQPTVVRAARTEAGLKHFKAPEYHGNPIDEAGSLVVTEWGWDFPDLVYRWASMTTTPVRILDLSLGLAGEFIEVFISRKSSSQ